MVINKNFFGSKYGAKKVIVDGIKFDSKHEANDWIKLKKLEESGDIKNLQRQVKFELQPKYETLSGEKIRAITYVADFVYEKNGVIYVQDSKGFRTKEYLLKRKMFMYKYPDYFFLES